ncbi:MAG: DUF4234 domain-containing protein [Corallococcus sp.]|nr:DUF4234 domain-containing protein [Corallococcus sp.]
MKQRKIWATVLLFIFTFGVYPLIWAIKFHAEVRATSGEGHKTWAHVLLWLFTFNAYPIYWGYACGKRLESFEGRNRAWTYFVLIILFPIGGIIAAALMQAQANAYLAQDVPSEEQFVKEDGAQSEE